MSNEFSTFMDGEDCKECEEKDSKIASLTEALKNKHTAMDTPMVADLHRQIASLKELVAEKMNPMTMSDHMKWLNKAKECLNET